MLHVPYVGWATCSRAIVKIYLYVFKKKKGGGGRHTIYVMVGGPSYLHAYKRNSRGQLSIQSFKEIGRLLEVLVTNGFLVHLDFFFSLLLLFNPINICFIFFY